MKILDRYIIGQFLKIFLICVLGVPFLFQVIDLTDRLDNFLSDGVGQSQVIAFYFYQLPYQMMLAFPIACLLAAVFTVSRMTRHFEVTAAKAGGISYGSRFQEFYLTVWLYKLLIVHLHHNLS